jgi:hypothetical protein
VIELKSNSILTKSDLNDLFFRSKDISSLKSFAKQLQEKKIIKSDLEILKEKSFSAYIIIRTIHLIRRCFSLDYRVQNHWLISYLNKYSFYLEKEGSIYCKNCGYPFPAYDFKCISCKEVDENAWDLFHAKLTQILDLNKEEQQESLEKAIETILKLSNLIQVKKEDEHCLNCGAPKNGFKCEYCDTIFK